MNADGDSVSGVSEGGSPPPTSLSKSLSERLAAHRKAMRKGTAEAAGSPKAPGLRLKAPTKGKQEEVSGKGGCDRDPLKELELEAQRVELAKALAEVNSQRKDLEERQKAVEEELEMQRGELEAERKAMMTMQAAADEALELQRAGLAKILAEVEIERERMRENQEAEESKLETERDDMARILDKVEVDRETMKASQEAAEAEVEAEREELAKILAEVDIERSELEAKYALIEEGLSAERARMSEEKADIEKQRKEMEAQFEALEEKETELKEVDEALNLEASQIDRKKKKLLHYKTLLRSKWETLLKSMEVLQEKAAPLTGDKN